MLTHYKQTPLLGFAAFSGTGKTTLLTQLLPLLVQHHYTVAVIKQSHHSINIDTPGKDSYRLQQTGIQQMLLASEQRSFLVAQQPPCHSEAQQLDTLLAQLQPDLDAIFIEGFRHHPQLRKMELHRPVLQHPLLYPDDPNIIAIASDRQLTASRPAAVAMLDLNDIEAIFQFILTHIIQP